MLGKKRSSSLKSLWRSVDSQEFSYLVHSLKKEKLASGSLPYMPSLTWCRFEVSILPKIRMSLKAFNNTKDIVWNLHNEHTNERTPIAFLRIDEQVKFSENRARDASDEYGAELVNYVKAGEAHFYAAYDRLEQPTRLKFVRWRAKLA
ncbi:hypothetical protein KSP39_PZI009481 [Platanthera zijinensis]|uniref:Uncharacterized protein n=1 Tax=Platanthera zijinensis TaxID=2320716 RepID=A0AAP0BMC7_9ASPA